MKYYNVQDVMEMTQKSQNKAYEIIRQLNKQFKKKYPEMVPIQGQVMKWYFDEAMGIKRGGESEKETTFKTVS